MQVPAIVYTIDLGKHEAHFLERSQSLNLMLLRSQILDDKILPISNLKNNFDLPYLNFQLLSTYVVL